MCLNLSICSVILLSENVYLDVHFGFLVVCCIYEHVSSQDWMNLSEYSDKHVSLNLPKFTKFFWIFRPTKVKEFKLMQLLQLLMHWMKCAVKFSICLCNVVVSSKMCCQIRHLSLQSSENVLSCRSLLIGWPSGSCTTRLQHHRRGSWHFKMSLLPKRQRRRHFSAHLKLRPRRREVAETSSGWSLFSFW